MADLREVWAQGCLRLPGIWAGLSAFTLHGREKPGQLCCLVLACLWVSCMPWCRLTGIDEACSHVCVKMIRQEKAVALTLLPEMSTSSLKWEIVQEASNICFLAHSQTALSNRDGMPATYAIYNFIPSTVKKKYKTVGEINFNNIFHLKYVNMTLI